MSECLLFDSHIKEPLLEKLPDSLVEDMRQHLVEENRLNIKYTGHELDPADYEKVTAGYLFEILNYLEYVNKLFMGKKEGTSEWEDAKSMVTVSDTLCKIARYPQEYGLKIDIMSRIPDGVYVGMTKEGDFNIFGLAEAKLGALDERALSQLKLTGSRTTMANIVEQVDALISTKAKEDLPKDLQQLQEVLQGRHLKVRWKDVNGKKELSMGLELLIPTRDEDDGLFDPKVTYKNTQIKTEYETTRDRERIKAKNSPFSAKEVFIMANKILQEMEQ